jgi:glycine/D-amino acid oxidase-like deaminating enzyme
LQQQHKTLTKLKVFCGFQIMQKSTSTHATGAPASVFNICRKPPDHEPLPVQVDVVVIGAGIMGCATAYYLAQAGVDVLVLDKSRIAGQQSTRAWGFVRQQARDPAEVPLAMASMQLWQHLEEDLQADLQWRQGGGLHTAHTEQELAAHEGWLNVARAFGLTTRLLSPSQVEGIVPGIATPSLGALYTPSDGQAEPRLVAPAYARRASERGARFVEGCGVTALDVAAGRIAGVQTERGGVRAKAVVCAAGVTSHRVLRTLGIDLPQHQVRGTVSRTSAGPAASPVSYIGNRMGWRQRRDGSFNIADAVQVDVDITPGHLRALQWYLGPLLHHHRSFGFGLNQKFIDDLLMRLPGSATAQEGGLVHEREPHYLPNRKRVHASIMDLHRMLPNQRGVRVVERWAGGIDVLPDGLPVIDAPPQWPGLLIATGFCGHGFAMGPIVGKVLANWFTTGNPGLDLKALRLARYAEGDVKPAYSLF